MSFKFKLSKILSTIGIKEEIKDLFFFSANWWNRIFNLLFNSVVINQNKDYTQIPVVIISYNQYTFLKELIDYLLQINHKKIIVIDNNSTYKPLVRYLDNLNNEKISVYKLDKNYGHLVFWKKDSIFKKYSKGYYIVTDPDIMPIKECPFDFINHLKKELDSNYRINKVGISLKIDDLPYSNLNREKIIEWEKQFWLKSNKKGNYLGNIDTTFAIYRPKSRNLDNFFYKAIRMKFPYQAQHKSWYIDSKNLSSEMNYLYENPNSSSSWKLDQEGNILRGIYEQK